MCACAPRVQLDNNISGLAPNTGMPVCYAPLVGTGNKGGELLEPPSLNTLGPPTHHLHTGVG